MSHGITFNSEDTERLGVVIKEKMSDDLCEFCQGEKYRENPHIDHYPNCDGVYFLKLIEKAKESLYSNERQDVFDGYGDHDHRDAQEN